MSSGMTPSEIGELIEPGMLATFGLEYDRWEPYWKKIYKTFDSKRTFEEFVQFAGFDIMGQRNPMQDAPEDAPVQGAVVQLRSVGYSKAFGISVEAWEDDQNNVVREFPQQMFLTQAETEEVLAATPFNIGFTTNGYDAVPWFSASHPQVRGGNFSNLSSSGDLSMLGLEAMNRLMSQMTDDRGKHVRVRGEELICHTDEEWTAKEFLESSGRPDSMNRGDNPAKGFLTYMAWPYLTDSDAYFVKTNVRVGAVAIDRDAPRPVREAKNFNRSIWWILHRRIVFGYVDPRGMLGCAGS